MRTDREKNKIWCGKCCYDTQKSTTGGFTVGSTVNTVSKHSTREERGPINTHIWLNTHTKSARNLIKLQLFIGYRLSVYNYYQLFCASVMSMTVTPSTTVLEEEIFTCTLTCQDRFAFQNWDFILCLHVHRGSVNPPNFYRQAHGTSADSQHCFVPQKQGLKTCYKRGNYYNKESKSKFQFSSQAAHARAVRDADHNWWWRTECESKGGQTGTFNSSPSTWQQDWGAREVRWVGWKVKCVRDKTWEVQRVMAWMGADVGADSCTRTHNALEYSLETP